MDDLIFQACLEYSVLQAISQSQSTMITALALERKLELRIVIHQK